MVNNIISRSSLRTSYLLIVPKISRLSIDKNGESRETDERVCVSLFGVIAQK
jgi:hypothetical protein